ncbi:hypothetical protein SLE2022_300490 [Rubroshorea leprosula]
MGDPNVVLVTGCAIGGIGYEYCKALAEQNCSVFASDIPQRMQDMLDLSSDKIETLELDVTSDESVSSAVNTVISKSGRRIDVLINNACIGSTDTKGRARASQGSKATSATIFARHVSKKVLSRRPPKQIVFGHMTGLFATLPLSPLWVRDLFFSTSFSLKKKV